MLDKTFSLLEKSTVPYSLIVEINSLDMIKNVVIY